MHDTTWFLALETLKMISALFQRDIQTTAEQQVAFEAYYSDEGDYPGSRIMTKVGNVAQINISGVLTRQPSWMLRYFGGGNTTYSDVIAAVAEAERDSKIEKVYFNINSPGGATDGLVEAMDAIKALTKESIAMVEGGASSAAYGIASQAGSIIAANRASVVGSIGVVAEMIVNPDSVVITSSNAPDKRPDLTTEDGKAVVRGWLDQMENIFITDIAEGRGITAQKVISDYGKGGIFVAQEALNRGMIDGIGDAAAAEKIEASSVLNTSSSQESKKTMDLNELKAKHPEVFKAAFDEGVAQERDRVTAHAIMAEASGDVATAMKAIKEGTAMTAVMQATYQAAGMRKNDVNARQADDATVAAAANISKTDPAAIDAKAQEDAFLAGLDGAL